jgi:hypothetical protein
MAEQRWEAPSPLSSDRRPITEDQVAEGKDAFRPRLMDAGLVWSGCHDRSRPVDRLLGQLHDPRSRHVHRLPRGEPKYAEPDADVRRDGPWNGVACANPSVGGLALQAEGSINIPFGSGPPPCCQHGSVIMTRLGGRLGSSK